MSMRRGSKQTTVRFPLELKMKRGEEINLRAGA